MGREIRDRSPLNETSIEYPFDQFGGPTGSRASPCTWLECAVPLNDVGRKQAAAAAERLTGLELDAIVSSPLSRAAETAGIIAAGLGLAGVGLDAELVDQGLGEAEGTPWAHLDVDFPGGEVPGLEPHSRLVERAVTALARIGSAHVNSNVIVVGHGAWINAVMSHAARTPDRRPGPGGNGSISEVVILDGRLELGRELIGEPN